MPPELGQGNFDSQIEYPQPGSIPPWATKMYRNHHRVVFIFLLSACFAIRVPVQFVEKVLPEFLCE
jgi:hypothetical protein